LTSPLKLKPLAFRVSEEGQKLLEWYSALVSKTVFFEIHISEIFGASVPTVYDNCESPLSLYAIVGYGLFTQTILQSFWAMFYS